MMTDPIADLLTRIRNAQQARQENTTAPYSKVKEQILKVLKSEKFIASYKASGEKAEKIISIEFNTQRPNLMLKRVSKPGQRIYVGYDEFKKVKSGLGINLISTSKGVMTGTAARKQKLGGELMCQVY